MRTLRDINLNRLTVAPETSVSAALLAMQNAGQAAAAVIEDDKLKGIITIEACVLSDSESEVREAMRGATDSFQLTEPIRQAAKNFVRHQADFLAVYDGKEFAGLLSALMLITELGRSWDPLTGLSWSDRLRDWGVQHLEAGQEITILFFDLNDFGLYNKKYGHTVGDAVIRGFATLLNRTIDPNRDILVRYGGDEFAIGTTRDRASAIAMLGNLKSKEFSVPGVKAPVSFSYGVSGGKRTQEPSRDHVAATLDNLINLASKDCIKNKPQTSLLAAVSIEESPAVQLLLDVDLAGPVSADGDRFQVHVRGRDRKYLGESVDPDSRYRGVAQAAVAALRKLDPSLQFTVDEIAFSYLDGKRFVEVWGQKVEGTDVVPFHIQHSLNGNVDSSVAKAVIKAYTQAMLVE